MRLITLQIHRAFPELDRFDDARCRKFVRAANRGIFHRLGRWTLLALGFVLVNALIGFAFYVAYSAFNFTPDTHTSEWVALVGMGAPMVLSFLGAIGFALLTRDYLLRRRIRQVIALRGTCQECDYSLLGLTVGPDLKVVCPECGAVTVADPSMNELTDGSKGPRVFAPADADPTGRITPPRRLVSKHTRKLLLRGIGGVVAIFVLAVVVLWLVVYLQTKADIRAAKADLADVSEFNARLESMRPQHLSETAPDVGAALAVLGDRLRVIDRAAVARVESELSDQEPSANAFVDYTLLIARRLPDGDEHQTAQSLRASEIAFAMVTKEGIDEQLCRLVVRGRWSVEWTGQKSVDEELNWSFPLFSNVRSFARLLALLVRHSHERRNVESFRSAVDASCALISQANAMPTLIASLVAASVDGLLQSNLRAVLISRPDREYVDAIRSAMQRFSKSPSFEMTVKTEESYTRRLLAHDFASHHPNPVVNMWRDLRGNPTNQFLLDFSTSESKFWWHERGRYRPLLAQVSAIYGYFVEMGKVAPHARSRTGVAPAVPAHPLFDSLVSWIPRVLRTNDGRVAEFRGLEQMVALELYRLDHGQYPADLEALRPSYLSEIPLDPYTGRPFRYKLLDSAADPHGRGYLLWSTGVDGIDDGGVAPLEARRSEAILGGKTKSGGPVDLVINEPSD